AKTTGYADARAFYEWLLKNRKDAFAAKSKAETEKGRLNALSAKLRDAKPEVRQQGLADILNAYCNKDAADIAAVREKLRNLIKDNPAAALPCLNDDRLAVRILIGNLFSESLGAEFQFDPWESAQTRGEVIERWNKALSGKI